MCIYVCQYLHIEELYVKEVDDTYYSDKRNVIFEAPGSFMNDCLFHELLDCLSMGKENPLFNTSYNELIIV